MPSPETSPSVLTYHTAPEAVTGEKRSKARKSVPGKSVRESILASILCMGAIVCTSSFSGLFHFPVMVIMRIILLVDRK